MQRYKSVYEISYNYSQKLQFIPIYSIFVYTDKCIAIIEVNDCAF